MSKFMYVFRGGAFVTDGLSPTEMQSHLGKWGAWIGELASAGHHQGGDPVQNGGKVVSGSAKTVTDGPYAELKDLVTGNLVIEAVDIDKATELAMGCPVFEFDGSVEIRPIADM